MINIHRPNTFAHRLRQCWWILTGQHWLHKAWQDGYDARCGQAFGQMFGKET